MESVSLLGDASVIVEETSSLEKVANKARLTRGDCVRSAYWRISSGEAKSCLKFWSGERGNGELSMSGIVNRLKSGCQRARFSSEGSSSSFNCSFSDRKFWELKKKRDDQFGARRFLLLLDGGFLQYWIEHDENDRYVRQSSMAWFAYLIEYQNQLKEKSAEYISDEALENFRTWRNRQFVVEFDGT